MWESDKTPDFVDALKRKPKVFYALCLMFCKSYAKNEEKIIIGWWTGSSWYGRLFDSRKYRVVAWKYKQENRGKCHEKGEK